MSIYPQQTPTSASEAYLAALTASNASNANPFITENDITGTLGFVPYQGAKLDLDLGAHNLKVSNIQFNTSAGPSSLVNGLMYYDGGLGGKNGFNFYSNDPSDSSYLFNFARQGTSLSYYASSAGDNWLSTPLNTNFVISTDGAASQAYEITTTQTHGWNARASSAQTPLVYQWDGANYTNQGSESISYSYPPSNIQFSTPISLQRTFNLRQSVITFSSANILTTGATCCITGPLVAGTNATISKNSALQIGGVPGSTLAIGIGSTNGYGLSCYAPTGGVNNNSAFFSGSVEILGNLFTDTTTGMTLWTSNTQKGSFWGKTPVVQQTGGVATAGATYTSNEQTMLQTLWNMCRTTGLLS